jgi:DNA-binding ferritin-like protein
MIENVNNIQVDRILNDVGSMFKGVKYHELGIILASIEGLALIHQHHHWTSKSSNYYGDHLLFERAYNTVKEDFDSVAERAIGMSTELLTEPSKILAGAHHFNKIMKQHGSASEPAAISYEAEEFFIDLIEACMDSLEEQGLLTRGLEQMLGNIADKHEGLIYLFKQRIKQS